MTPQEENKILGIGHLVYGGYNALVLLLISLFTFPVLLALMFAALAGGESGGGIAFAVMLLVTLVVAVFYLLLTIPAFIAGYGLLKQKSWAKTAAYISAVLSALHFPMGTGLCVFTFIFLAGEKGKTIYGKDGARAAGELNSPPPPNAYGWSSNPHVAPQRERQYAPPPTPPPTDWRR